MRFIVEESVFYGVYILARNNLSLQRWNADCVIAPIHIPYCYKAIQIVYFVTKNYINCRKCIELMHFLHNMYELKCQVKSIWYAYLEICRLWIT